MTTAPSTTYKPSYEIVQNTDTAKETENIEDKSEVYKPSLSGELTVSASADSNGNITLSWNSVEGADSYIVYYYTDGAYERLKTTSSASYTVKKAANGREHSFLVRCVVNGTEQLSSSGSADVKVYYKPVVTAAAKDGKVTLRWKAVPGAEKYAVYRMNGKLKKVSVTSKTAVKIKQKEGDTGYAVKAYVNGKWTKVTRADIVSAKEK